MNKLPIWTRLRLWIAGLCFKLFIWGNHTTQEEYWSNVYAQEYIHRHKLSEVNVPSIDIRYEYDINGKMLVDSPLLDKRSIFNFKNNRRRSGRTSLLISKSIFELMYTGETVLCDHYWDHGNYTQKFFHSHIIPLFLKSLGGLLNMEKREIFAHFKIVLVYNDYRLEMLKSSVVGLYVATRNKNSFQV